MRQHAHAFGRFICILLLWCFAHATIPRRARVPRHATATLAITLCDSTPFATRQQAMSTGPWPNAFSTECAPRCADKAGAGTVSVDVRLAVADWPAVFSVNSQTKHALPEAPPAGEVIATMCQLVATDCVNWTKVPPLMPLRNRMSRLVLCCRPMPMSEPGCPGTADDEF